ncbi:double zinc ribbon domain-containing protein [Natrialbaceae archaeon A-CW1-1]
MGKITFRADDDLVDELEAFDASKSEVMREALRTYLDEHATGDVEVRSANETAGESLDAMLTERIDTLITNRLGEQPTPQANGQDVNVTISLEGDGTISSARASDDRTAADPRASPARNTSEQSQAQSRTCGQCGTGLASDHVFCPNCGEKATHRVFCDCGDEVRSDWAFCPGCGRRTPAADVLDSNQP